MNYGIDPHLGGFLNDRSVGYWTNFCAANGFEVLQFGLDFRLLEKNLDEVFTRSVMMTLRGARRRGLKVHISIEPLFSRLDSHRLGEREAALAFLRRTLSYLLKHLQPALILLCPGKPVPDPNGGRIGRWAAGYDEIRNHFPFARIGVKLGRKNGLIGSRPELEKFLESIRDLEAAVEVGWLFRLSGPAREVTGGLIELLDSRLVQLNWNSLSFAQPRLLRSLGAGDLRETDYYFLLSRLSRRHEVCHLFDYRDRRARFYLNDRLMLQGLDIRLERE